MSLLNIISNLLSSKPSSTLDKLRHHPAFSESIYLTSVEALLMAIVFDNDLIYFNDKYNPNIFKDNHDGTKEFRGRVYKLIIQQNDGHQWFVFYAIETDDPYSLQLAYDYIAVQIVKEMLVKIPGLIDPNKITKLPTAYTYTCWQINDKYMISNISGSDAFIINGYSIISGSRDNLLNKMK